MKDAPCLVSYSRILITFFSQYVEDELRFAPENLCVPRAEIETRIKEALDFTGISYLRHRKIQELSGGRRSWFQLRLF